MKIKDLPSARSKIKLTSKNGVELIGTIFSAYKMPPGDYGIDRWRVPFLIEGQDVGRMKSFSVKSIEKCEVIDGQKI